MRRYRFLFFLVAFLCAGCATSPPREEGPAGSSISKWGTLAEEQKMDILFAALGRIDVMSLYEMNTHACEQVLRRELALPYIAEDISNGVESCSGKYFELLAPRENKRVQTEKIEGMFGGLGIRLKERSGRVVVGGFATEAAARRLGTLRRGDVVVAVHEEGERIAVKSIRQAIGLLRGDAGTYVKLIVRRGGKALALGFRRVWIDPNSVEAARRFGDVGYIRLKHFPLDAPDELERAIRELDLPGAHPELIIDLRENRGGVVHSAREMSFLFSGKLSDRALAIRKRSGEEVHTIGGMKGAFVYPHALHEKAITKKPGIFSHYRVALLIGLQTASAAEIYAGAVLDWGNERNEQFFSVGERTFGKGIMQALPELPHGARVRFTTGEFFVGNGRAPIHGVGITPDYRVPDSRVGADGEVDMPLTATKKDAQFMKALEILREENTSKAPAPPGRFMCKYGGRVVYWGSNDVCIWYGNWRKLRETYRKTFIFK